MEAELRELDVPYSIADLRPTTQTSLGSILRVAHAAGILCATGVDVVHANDPFTYRLLSIASTMCRVKAKICHFHHPIDSADTAQWALAVAPRVILTPTLFMSERVVELLGGRCSTPVHAVGNPVDVDWFTPAADSRSVRARIGIDPYGPHVTIVGSIAPHKGHDCFLRMSARLLRIFPQATFHVVGSARPENASWETQLRRMAFDFGLADSVKWWGFVKNETARDILRSSDLFVLPSKEEGFCLAVAEAQACEVPVLTSSIRPLDEVLQDGAAGWLVDPDDDAQFAARAVDILSSPALARSMGASGRQFIVGRYSARAFIEQIASHYARRTVRDVAKAGRLAP